MATTKGIRNWVDDTGWIHFHPKSDPRNKSDGFGDSPHHTGMVHTRFISQNTYTAEDQDQFLYGLLLRHKQEGLIRHPRTKLPDGRYEPSNRDQIQPILFPISYYGNTDLAWAVWERTEDEVGLIPIWHAHIKAHVYRSCFREHKIKMLWLHDIPGIVDTLLDILKPKKNWSSIIKNIQRQEVRGVTDTHTLPSRINDYLINRHLKPLKPFYMYWLHGDHHNNGMNTPMHEVWEDGEPPEKEVS